MGTKYKCMEGEELSRLGGVWFASYVAYDVTQRFSGQAGLPQQQNYWNNRRGSSRGPIARFKTTQLWVLMPNGVVDKSSRTILARNQLIKKQGGVSIHAYWALWMLQHCSARNIATNTVGMSYTLFKTLLLDSLLLL